MREAEKYSFMLHTLLGETAATVPHGHLFVAALHIAAVELRLLLRDQELPVIACSQANRYQALQYKDRSGDGVIEAVPVVIADFFVLHGHNSCDRKLSSRLQLRYVSIFSFSLNVTQH